MNSVLSYESLISVPIFTRIISTLRSIWVTFVTDNPLTWAFRQGKRNKFADVEGPFYILGAPQRSIETGKAVVATVEDFKEGPPFLLCGQLLSPSGKPLSNVTVDWWQSNTKGDYFFSKYRLRGKFTTDSNGCFECLTVPPARYGLAHYLRTAHFHIMFTHVDERKKVHELTTQLYVCRANDPAEMKSDFVNAMRKPRIQNMIEAYSLETEKKPFMDLPSLEDRYAQPKSDDDLEELDRMRKRVEWWNNYLLQTGVQVSVCAFKLITMGN